MIKLNLEGFKVKHILPFAEHSLLYTILFLRRTTPTFPCITYNYYFIRIELNLLCILSFNHSNIVPQRPPQPTPTTRPSSSSTSTRHPLNHSLTHSLSNHNGPNKCQTKYLPTRSKPPSCLDSPTKYQHEHEHTTRHNQQRTRESTIPQTQTNNLRPFHCAQYQDLRK